jgi:hypothetical protein
VHAARVEPERAAEKDADEDRGVVVVVGRGGEGLRRLLSRPPRFRLVSLVSLFFFFFFFNFFFVAAVQHVLAQEQRPPGVTAPPTTTLFGIAL